jgi:hypothetical protein
VAKYPGLTEAQAQYAESFENQGYSREQAIKKAKEVAPTPAQRSAQRARQARKGGKK